ncbi:DUF2029 domain-containing protein [Streptomyces sp. SID3343]|uniref:DUF2029 domain-containing protein n=1 Tax=Streptomyces sp. SID3343 TaxID=2690260 RepID=UPI001369A092|nr:DUF2029 domain-containing protein [Streptomyces sp. SID3343]MYW05056.1 DUF2029 domain-containing protein [Streptomyces sp. SID3343]
MFHVEHSLGPVAIGLLTVSIGLVVLTGLLGPSAAQPPVPGGPGWLPPYRFDAHPPAWLVTGLLLAPALVGAGGLVLALRQLARGWAPEPRRLTVGGVVAALAVVCVPPMGSADHLVYAAYGRLATTGGSPYTDTAATLVRDGDPVGRAVEAPWTDTPSVYGPVATAEQWFAARLGGTSVHTIVLVLTLLGAAAFVLSGLLLQRAAGPDPRARARVAILWSLNPLLLFVAVNAGHLDAFAVVFAVGALVAVRRSAVLAGVLVGLACAAKVSLGLYVLALAWGLRGRPRAMGAMVGSGLAVGILTYLPVGFGAFDQLRENAKLVSLAVPLRLVLGPMESALGHDTARSSIGLVGWLLGALVVWLLARTALRARPAADVAGDSAAVAALLTVAWLLTTPYSLPWYDVAAWAPLVLLGPSALDHLLLARTTLLVCAYVPGRDTPLPDTVDTLQRTLRGTVGPWVGAAILVAVVLVSRRAGGPPLPRSRRSTTAPRS